MDYNELVNSIVEDLLDEKLSFPETPSDKGTNYRNKLASTIRQDRASVNPVSDAKGSYRKALKQARSVEGVEELNPQTRHEIIANELHLYDARNHAIDKATARIPGRGRTYSPREESVPYEYSDDINDLKNRSEY